MNFGKLDEKPDLPCGRSVTSAFLKQDTQRSPPGTEGAADERLEDCTAGRDMGIITARITSAVGTQRRF